MVTNMIRPFLIVLFLSFGFSLPVLAKPQLLELNDRFGPNDNKKPHTIVPYYHLLKREASFQSINKSLKKTGYGPRTFLRADVHAIILKTFDHLRNKPHMYVYGEGSWGGKHGATNLEPHKTHTNGRYLDIFMPVTNLSGEPRLFPNTEKSLFGYAVNFSKNGIGQGNNQDVQIDWPGLFALFHGLCEHGGSKLKLIYIAQDLYPVLSAKTQMEAWQALPKTCQAKIKPIKVLGPYQFAGHQLMVDHDDHIHVEFK